MKKAVFIAVFLVFAVVFQAAAQITDAVVTVSGDITTIYTLGNASEEQKIPDATAVGAYFNSPTQSARKNGYFTATNLHTTFRPFPWLEGYFKLYAIDRPGSLYLPLQLENNDVKKLANDLTLDSVYGRVSVLEALGYDLPFGLFMKAGKYKAQASHFGAVSKYQTEQLLYLLHTKTELTYELGVTLNSPYRISLSGATNYLLSEATQRLYDENGGMGLHGTPVLNEYAPQFVVLGQLTDMVIGDRNKLSAEILYGNNVSGIYSGNAAGFSARFTGEPSDGFSIPIGLSFVFYEKNIDLLGRAAVMSSSTNPVATTSFRNSLSAGLGAGVRYSSPDTFDLDFNLAGTFSSIQHYYRTDLTVIKLSADTMFTLQKRFFLGAGLILGTLADAEWKTRDDVIEEDFNHTFTLANNMGYEFYGGINLGSNGKFVIGFNQNKGLSLNQMLEAKPEGQMKYKQEGTEWTFSDRLVEAGGLYFKFLFRF
jgi:hypothetical protein